MMKVMNKQSGEVRDIERIDWESPNHEYQRQKQSWVVLDEGDPVMLYYRADDGTDKEMGPFDREHATRMINDSDGNLYIRSIEKMETYYEGLSESELIDQILKEAEQNWISLMRATPDNYQNAVEKMKRLGLLKAVSKDSSEITQEGYDAIEIGGFDKWNAERKRRKNPQPPSINVGGHAVIGDNNSGVNQSRDFLNSASPIMQNNIPKEKPAESPIKKSDHTTWDKLKYIAGISAAIAAIIGLVKACMS